MEILPEAELEVKTGSIPANWNLDASLLEEELGFEPKYTAHEGLRTTAAMVRQRQGLDPVEGVDVVEHYSSG